MLGVVLGTLLFVAKLGSFRLLVPKKIRRWIHTQPIAQGVLDIIFGYLGLHVLAVGGGSMLAMMALVVYTAESMLYIYLNIMARKATEFIQERRNRCVSSGRQHA
jgi:hypothetical protein